PRAQGDRSGSRHRLAHWRFGSRNFGPRPFAHGAFRFPIAHRMPRRLSLDSAPHNKEISVRAAFIKHPNAAHNLAWAAFKRDRRCGLCCSCIVALWRAETRTVGANASPTCSISRQEGLRLPMPSGFLCTCFKKSGCCFDTAASFFYLEGDEYGQG